MNEKSNYLLYGVLIISVFVNITTFLGGSGNKLAGAAKELSTFGSGLGKISKTNPITNEQKKEIEELARIPTPISKNLHNNAVLTLGTNNINAKPIVLRSDTGEKVDPCGSTEIKGNLIQGCDVKIVDPPEALISALNAYKPIKGNIIKSGKEIPATFIIEVKALYKGSYCETFFLGGDQYTVCWDIPPF